MRRDVTSHRLPVAAAVRPEEYINFFDHGYAEPDDAHPFSIDLEVAPSKFGDGKHLMRVGLQGEHRDVANLKPTNLVLLLDVSGSMQSSDKLPMVVESVHTLIDNLRPTDTISIVTYAGQDRVMIEPTQVRYSGRIKRALSRAGSFAGGATNADAGIVTAYRLAERGLKKGGNNRVIIMTDGDFNVGRTGESLFNLIDEYRDKGISLTCMGYGRGNYHDMHMENLSKRGNGNYFYVDSEAEADRVFGTDLASTLEVIAADVKIQVGFDPAVVKSYRLVGYENRVMNNEDFRDDTKDAGEIGPGHTVTAFYELELYPKPEVMKQVAEVRVRYKSQYGASSSELTRAVTTQQVHSSFESAPASFQFGAAVAEYAELLRRSKHVESPDPKLVVDLLERHAGADEAKKELVGLAGRAMGYGLGDFVPAVEIKAAQQ